MKLENEANIPARLLRTGSPTADDTMLGCVIARPTFTVDKNGNLTPRTGDDAWPIPLEPTPSVLGVIPNEKPFYTGGIDVLIGGVVRQPGGEARARLDVEVEVGRLFRRRYAIFGDRAWTLGAKGKLVATEPKPFVAMELSYARAFGGATEQVDDYRLGYPPNTDGKGFYLDNESALGQALPNIEDPDALIEGAMDRPIPVGLGYYPMNGSLRALESIRPEFRERAKHDREALLTPADMLPLVLNAAQPNMVIHPENGPQAGDLVRLSHGLGEGDLWFKLPDLAYHVAVDLEQRHYEAPLHLDQIGIIAGAGVVFFSLRCVFEYTIVPRERRRAVLREGAPSPPPTP